MCDGVSVPAGCAAVLRVDDGHGELLGILPDGEAEEGDLEGRQHELVEEEADALLHPVKRLEHARRQLATALRVEQHPFLHGPLRLLLILLRLPILDRL